MLNIKNEIRKLDSLSELNELSAFINDCKVMLGRMSFSVGDKVYVFSNEDDHHQLICTYNIPQNEDNYIEGVDTIALHRKKQTNTLYTINALNEIIREKNQGVLDKSFPIEWSEFHNTLLLVNDEGLNKIRTRIYTIVNVDTWETDQNLKNEL